MPESTGSPVYDKTRMTCTLPVHLEPGRSYLVGINSASYRNFKSEDGVPVEPTAIVFATKKKDGTSLSLDQRLRAQYERVAKQSSVSHADKVEAERLNAEAWTLWNQRKLKEAENTFEKAVAKDPGPRQRMEWPRVGTHESGYAP